MDIQKSAEEYRNYINASPREEKVIETINKSKEAFCAKEQERVMEYREFLWEQAGFIQKRWWLLQVLLLYLAGLIIPYMEKDLYIQRSMGIAGVLFVVMVIPELWKNQLYGCTEIELSSYYSLRQIYSARILLFGLTDIIMLTVFCIVLHGKMYFTISGIMSQFLFPMAVTACICFGILCNKYTINGAVPVLFCVIWSAVWWLVTLNGRIYEIITLPVWTALLLAAFAILAFAVYKTINNCKSVYFDRNGGLKWN